MLSVRKLPGLRVVSAYGRYQFVIMVCSQGNRGTPGVIYVGHLPVGLFEPQLKSYFQQFGEVRRLRLSRSKKVTQGGFRHLPGLHLTSVNPAKVGLWLKMVSDVPLVWDQINEPKVWWCIKLITCSVVGRLIKPMSQQNSTKLIKL